MRLSHDHSRKLSDLLLELYEPADLQTFRRRTLSSLAAAFGNQMVCHNEIGPSGSLSVLRPELADFEPLRQAFFRHAHEHPSIAHLQRTREAGAVKTSDFLPQTKWCELGLYHEFYKKLEIRYQLTIGAELPGSEFMFLAVSRKDRDFTEEERLLLTLFRPHFLRAYANARKNGANAAPHGSAPPAIDSPSQVPQRELGLTAREAEVLFWMAQGKTNAEIAGILGLSVFTVKTYVKGIFNRLDVSTRSAAVAALFQAPRR
jgi:DNA-binding CsgD family transcriptional regulator